MSAESDAVSDPAQPTDGRRTSPSVSVILPTLNERAFITDCVDSLLSQDYEGIGEILVVDGGSTDGTRELVERRGGPIILLDNPGITAASAMNVGIQGATGEIVVRADAHTVYGRDYVRRNVEVLLSSGADNVGGPMRPVGTTRFGRAVAAVTTSRFGVGPGVFHYATRPQTVDTVYLGCWRRRTLVELGGYDDTELQWAAEDQEFNYRLRRAGGTVLVDPSIRSTYFPRESVRALARQYSNYGVAKASTYAKHGRLPSWRPLVPAAMVAGAAGAAVLGRGAGRVFVPVVHLTASLAVAMRLARRPGVTARDSVIAILVCHWSYGVGFWRGLWRVVLGKPFEIRPRGHR